MGTMRGQSAWEDTLDKLSHEISKLKPYRELDYSAPSAKEPIVYVPIEGTYNKRFLCRMYILRNHMVENCVISRFGYIQYQIPVSARNTELIVLALGSHIQAPWFYNYCTEIGDSLCTNYLAEMVRKVPLIGIITRLESGLEKKDQSLLQFRQRYQELYTQLLGWVQNIYELAYKDYLQDDEYTHKIFWKSEYLLYQFVNLIYPDSVFQYQDESIRPQSLDIYIPSKRQGVEYQGKQHYMSIPYFGGEEKFEDSQARDKRKKAICDKENISLKYWNYSEKITMYSVLKFFDLHIIPSTESIIRRSLKKLAPLPVHSLLLENIERVSDHKSMNTESPAPQYEIRMYSKQGKYVKAFGSYDESASNTGISKKQIQKVCNGYADTAGGYIWRKVIEEQPKENIAPIEVEYTGAAKAVFQVSRTGEVVAEFTSIRNAEKISGINAKSIRDTLSGKQKTAGGFYWIYKNEDCK